MDEKYIVKIEAFDLHYTDIFSDLDQSIKYSNYICLSFTKLPFFVVFFFFFRCKCID